MESNGLRSQDMKSKSKKRMEFFFIESYLNFNDSKYISNRMLWHII